MKRLIVIWLVVFVAIFAFKNFPSRNAASSVKAVTKLTPSPTPLPLTDNNLWSLIQKWRTDNGFQPYIKDQILCDFAKIRIERASTHYDQFHVGEHFMFQEDIKSFVATLSGFPPNTYLSFQENADEGYNSERTLNEWLSSKPHRHTLEQPYKYSCIATKYPYAVQIFSNL